MTFATAKDYFKRDGWWAPLGALAIAFYYWRFSRWGLHAGFTHDDLMNGGRAIRDSYGKILGEIVAFWNYSDSYRPLGTLFYRVMFDVFGFTHYPFRVVLHVIMAFNLFLAYRFFRLLFDRREIAMIGALIFAYKPYTIDLYFNSGYCYDILCFLFYYAAMLVYFHARLAGRLLTGKEIAAFVAFVWLGMNAKETIVSVPAVVVLAELFWFDRTAPLARRLAPGLAAGAMAVIFIVGRVHAPQGLAHEGGYKTEYTASRFLDRGGHYLTQFLGLPDEAAGAVLGIGFLAVVAAALASGRVGPHVAAAITVIGMLPLAFIEGRSLAQVYIAYAGASLLLAWVLVQVSRVLFRYRWRAAALFVVVLAWQWRTAKALPPNIYGLFRTGWTIHRTIASARALNLAPPRDARILMEQDPLPDFRWASTFLFWILYRDPTVFVDWANEPHQEATPPKYYVVLTSRDGVLERVR